MKKTVCFTAAALTLAVLCTMAGSTLSYFTDRDTAEGAKVSAGCLEVTIDLSLANYGVPSDTLLSAYGNSDTPAKSAVTVTNTGSIGMDYTLCLTADKKTAELLDPNGFSLRDTINRPLSHKDLLSNADGSVTYVYEIANALPSGESDTFGLALTWRGATLIDGNDYQKAGISITPSVTATQTGNLLFSDSHTAEAEQTQMATVDIDLQSQAFDASTGTGTFALKNNSNVNIYLRAGISFELTKDGTPVIADTTGISVTASAAGWRAEQKPVTDNGKSYPKWFLTYGDGSGYTEVGFNEHPAVTFSVTGIPEGYEPVIKVVPEAVQVDAGRDALTDFQGRVNPAW